MKKSYTKSNWFFIINIVVCVLGTAVIFFFAFGVETNGTFANTAMLRLLEYRWLIIAALFVLGMLVCWPVLKKKK